VGAIPLVGKGGTGARGVRAVGEGIVSYRGAQAVTRGLKGELQGHHIAEIRHLKHWRMDVRDAPSVVMSKAEHLEWTSKLKEALPYGVRYEKPEVWAAYQRVYETRPDWLEAIAPYFK
jgi:hypothetical protein